MKARGTCSRGARIALASAATASAARTLPDVDLGLKIVWPWAEGTHEVVGAGDAVSTELYQARYTAGGEEAILGVVQEPTVIHKTFATAKTSVG